MARTCSNLGRFLRREGKCLVWIGRRNRNGYGCIDYRERGVMRKKMAHRLAYEKCVGPIPHGMVLDHLCRNRTCCNPKHLEPVTVRDNTLRGNAVLFTARASPTG